MAIYYVTGEPTRPKVKPALIMHVCSGKGIWGGFGLLIDKLSARPKNAYLAKACYELGEVQFVSITRHVTVANIIANQSTNADTLLYPELARAFYTINEWCDITPNVTLHARLIGDWLVTEPLMCKILRRPVYIYDDP